MFSDVFFLLMCVLFNVYFGVLGIVEVLCLGVDIVIIGWVVDSVVVSVVLVYEFGWVWDDYD